MGKHWILPRYCAVPVATNDNGPRWGRFDTGDGVADGTRTHDDQNHNLGLYQLSYSHRS